ncbi:MAG: M1 family metallopeptidase [Bacteroidia bacterium]
MIKRFLILSLLTNVMLSSFGQDKPYLHAGYAKRDAFKQLEEELPTPNTYRTASGTPGHEYWQQRADYKMQVSINDETQRLDGNEVITYYNQSPDVLTYLWLQLDQNLFQENSDAALTRTSSFSNGKVYMNDVKNMFPTYDGGFKLLSVENEKGEKLPYTINKTMMRIDLPQPLKPKDKVSFRIKWWYNINDRDKVGGRSGYEFFPEDKNYLYTMAQFFPRMAVYNDNEGWQHKQFLGSGEFTLPFGNYEVEITVPSDHIVGASGTLQNAKAVLSAQEITQFEKAQQTFDNPVIIVNSETAKNKETNPVQTTKTWKFVAENVRDFAFASSRKFIWDAMAVNVGGKNILAMSYYPKEGNPLWEQYSTRVVAHTISSYSKHTIDYNYPVAISVHTKNMGMEYPMICFNGGRPEPDGTYSEGVKTGMISVIIHEVGHNFFPMIINSDERQWTWMDEGLNTFVQFLAEQEWDRDYPSRRGHAYKIANYMKSDKSTLEPIMTNSEQLKQFGNNAYGKTATGLNILRETIMGRELFDYAFKEYCRRWAFKHPTPADFFRTMEDASAIDLDWFWWSWFFSTDNTEIELAEVKWMKIDGKNPEIEKPLAEAAQKASATNKTDERYKNSTPESLVEKDEKLKDFYNSYNPFAVTESDKTDYERFMANLTEEEKKLLALNYNFYEITFKNNGGIPMPLILLFEMTDGSQKEIRIPAEIWRYNNEKVSKVFAFEKEVKQISLDPYLETADVDTDNNYFPPISQPTRFQLYKGSSYSRYSTQEGENPMQKAKKK